MTILLGIKGYWDGMARILARQCGFVCENVHLQALLLQPWLCQEFQSLIIMDLSLNLTFFFLWLIESQILNLWISGMSRIHLQSVYL